MKNYRDILLRRGIDKEKSARWSVDAFQATTLDELLERVVSNALILYEGTLCVLLLIEDSHLVIKAVCGFGQEVVIGSKIPIDGSFSGRLVKRGEPRLFSDVSQVLSQYRNEQCYRGSMISTPLVFNKNIIGILNICRCDDNREDFSREEFNRVISYGSQVAFAIRSQQLKGERTAELKESEKRFKDITDNAREWIWEVDAKGKYVYGSPVIEKILGYKVEEVLTKHFYDLFHPEEREELKQAAFEAFARREPFYEFVNRNIHKDGKEVWLLTSGVPLVDENGELRGYRGVDVDITERKQAEKALRTSEQRYRLLAENVSDIIWTMDMNLNITYISPSVEQLIGYAPEELLGKSLSLILPARSFETFISIFEQERVLSEDKSTHDLKPRTLELETKCKDGTPLWTEAKFSFLYDPLSRKAVALVGVTRDISERKKLQLQFLQSQKMETIGRLAGGIAHDFNNMLTGIINYADLVNKELEPDHAVSDDVCQIVTIAKRAANLTNQLLVFSRRQMVAPRVVNLNDIISDTDRMLRRIIKETVEFVTVLSPDLDLVNVDVAQIQQVIINIVVNASDAMPSGGKLFIETSNMFFDSSYTDKYVDLSPGEFVLLAVSDTGVGMDKETREHIFEPFFTTKEVGKGTGLGLATVYGIVKQHKGYVHVYSEEGHGTTFKVYLPVVKDKQKEIVPQGDVISLRKAEETILLVEDDELVRKVVIRILGDLGYKIIEACEGKQALERISEYGDKIDIVITDLVMPGMSGKELAKRIVDIIPDCKILFVSGYTSDFVTYEELINKNTDFLQKPFTAESLIKKLDNLLD